MRVRPLFRSLRGERGGARCLNDRGDKTRVTRVICHLLADFRHGCSQMTLPTERFPICDVRRSTEPLIGNEYPPESNSSNGSRKISLTLVDH